MKEIKRDKYLQELIDRRETSSIKIITGIRRCGKSFLLDPLFKNYLIENGVDKNHIIKIDLDNIENKELLDGLNLYKYVMDKIKDENMHYILLDEIQLVSDFESVLNSFLRKKNLDVYVTGSNSKFLSTDIVTEFRGRGDEVRIYPLSFREFFSAYVGDKRDAFKEYINFGGMPRILEFKNEQSKSKYLKDLFEMTYLKDIIDRNKIERTEVLDSIVNILASSVGSLTNANNITNTFKSKGYLDVSNNTVSVYINYLLDAFLIKKVERYDIRGRNYISTPSKYYFTDIGLRNARLNYREVDEEHLMENIIYNELLYRGYNVDVGVVELFEKNKANKTARKQLEVDFIVNQGSKRYYIQVAWEINSKEKQEQEKKSLNKINDNFKKIIIIKDDIQVRHTEDGITIMGILDFLLNENSLDL